MGKTIGTLVFAIMACCYADVGRAQSADVLPAATYPDPQCTKPDLKLIKPPEFKHDGNMLDGGAVGSYNSLVKAFNRATESYASCIHTYVENANREVQRVQDQANSDMKRIRDNANASMATIQDKTKKAVREANDFVAQQDAMAAELQKKVDKGAR